MCLQGRIANWKDDKGFGFIAPAGGGDQVFVHIKAFVDRARRPAIDQVVTYELEFDAQKRPRAVKVALAHQRMAPVPRAGYGTRRPSAPPDTLAFPVAAALLYFAVLAWLAVTRQLHLAVPAALLALSLVTFVVYANDKSQAELDRQRIPEKTLHMMALCGGWPGAWIAQRVFRHKSKKVAFQRVFWCTVIAHCAALMFFVTPAGRHLLGRLMA